MYNSFISVVSVVNTMTDKRELADFLTNVYDVLQPQFSHLEIVIINNLGGEDLSDQIAPLSEELRHHVFVLNLASTINRNNALLAGLDRSNGDYTVIFDIMHWRESELILSLFKKSREGFDIVYLQSQQKNKANYRWFHSLFHWIIRRYSQLQIDEKALDSRIISRRALNSLLRLRENLRYMKAIYSIVGFNTTYLPTTLSDPQQETFGEKFKTSLVAISSFTTFLRSILLWIFILSFFFLVGVISNALKVKFTGYDLFGVAAEASSGWTFLVILIAIFFATTSLNIYLMSIYLSNIYNEIKQRPLYIIESIKRF